MRLLLWRAEARKREDLVGVVDHGIDAGDLLEDGQADADPERPAKRGDENLRPACLRVRRQVVGDDVETLLDLRSALGLHERFPSVGPPSHLHQPARRVRHDRSDADQHDAGHDREPEHQPPARVVAERGVHDVGQQDADRDRELIARDEPASYLLRGHLRRIQRTGDRGDADTEADDEPRDRQDSRALGDGLAERPECEEHAGDDQRARPSELVRETAPEQRADERAQRDQARHDLLHRRTEVEARRHSAQRAGDDALVVAEQHPGQDGHERDHDQPRSDASEEHRRAHRAAFDVACDLGHVTLSFDSSVPRSTRPRRHRRITSSTAARRR